MMPVWCMAHLLTISLEVQFVFEYTVQQLAVLASVRAVDPVV